MIHNPHDALFKAVFQHPENAAAELEHILERDLAATVDWSSLALEPGSYVDPELADRHSDLLFSARAHAGGEQLFVYLLFEHQSSHDSSMALRLRRGRPHSRRSPEVPAASKRSPPSCTTSPASPTTCASPSFVPSWNSTLPPSNPSP